MSSLIVSCKKVILVNFMGEKILLVSHDCPGCEQLRQHLTKLGVADKYRVIDVSTVEGQRITDELGITHVPSCIVAEETQKGLKARACSEDEFLQLIEGK